MSKPAKEPAAKDKKNDKPSAPQQKAAEVAPAVGGVTVLETSGILDAYEYFLRQICKNGLPPGNVYEFAAQQILKFERKRNAEIKKRVALKQSLEALEAAQTQDQASFSKSPDNKKAEKKDNKGAPDKAAPKKDAKGDKSDKTDKTEKSDKKDKSVENSDTEKKEEKKEPPKKK